MHTLAAVNNVARYITVFVIYHDIWWVVALAWVLLAIGVAGLVVSIRWIKRTKIRKWWSSREGLRPGIFLLCSVFWLMVAVLAASMWSWNIYYLVSSYRTGAAKMVEGPVHVIHRQPESGHAVGDVIEVDNVRLVVDYFVVTPAYKQTISHGGVLVEGAYVRIWYVGRAIVRIDLRNG